MLRFYAEWLAEVACRPFSLVVVAVASAANMVLATVTVVTAQQISDGLFAGLTLLVLSTGVALVSWCLLAVVRLSTVVARLEVQQQENVRRLDRLDK